MSDKYPRPEGTILIVLRHHAEPEKYAPKTKTCQDYNGRKGCGQTIIGYKTYPKESSMYFDSPPRAVETFEPDDHGMVVAAVKTVNVHWATCPARNKPRDTTTLR